MELDRPGGKRESFALNEKLPWNYRIVLLDNIFPLAESKDPAGRFHSAPADVRRLGRGADRPAGLVYHLWLENTGTAPLQGHREIAGAVRETAGRHLGVEGTV